MTAKTITASAEHLENDGFDNNDWRGQYEAVDRSFKEWPVDRIPMFTIVETLEFIDQIITPMYSLVPTTWLSSCQQYLVYPRTTANNNQKNPSLWGTTLFKKNIYPNSSWQEWRVNTIVSLEPKPFKKAEKRLKEKQADPENYVWLNSEAEMPVQRKRTSIPNSRYKDYVVTDVREVHQGILDPATEGVINSFMRLDDANVAVVADTSEVEVAGIQGSPTYEDLGTAVMTTLPSNQTPRAQLPTSPSDDGAGLQKDLDIENDSILSSPASRSAHSSTPTPLIPSNRRRNKSNEESNAGMQKDLDIENDSIMSSPASRSAHISTSTPLIPSNRRRKKSNEESNEETTPKRLCSQQGCISREEFNELKALIHKVYKVVRKEKKLKYPATEAEYHMTFVKDYLANTVDAVPCKEPDHVVALNTIFGDIKFATSAVFMLANKYECAASVGRFLILGYKEFVTDSCSNNIHWVVTASSTIGLGAMSNFLAVLGVAGQVHARNKNLEILSTSKVIATLRVGRKNIASAYRKKHQLRPVRGEDKEDVVNDRSCKELLVKYMELLGAAVEKFEMPEFE